MPPVKSPTFPASRATISVIIPVWREHEELASLLPMLREMPAVADVVVAFAGEKPAVMKSAERRGARWVDASLPNRGRQMDLGSAQATGEWLLFHHVDTFLTNAHVQALARLADDRVIGGAFYRKFDERHPMLRFLEPIERWHNRSFGALFGDQSIFVRREIFHELGGFRGLPLMEDVDFSRRLRRRGKIALLDPPIVSSPRKHLAHGPWRTTFTNALLLALYHLGVPPQRLHSHYYRLGASGVRAATNYHPAAPTALQEVPTK